MFKINILYTIRQGISYQENNVSIAIIQNYQAKSQCIDWGNKPSTSTIIVEGTPQDKLDNQLDSIKAQFQDLRNKGAIDKVPDIKDFINSPDKVVANKPKGLVDQIIQQYYPKELKEEDSNNKPLLPKVSNLVYQYLGHICTLATFPDPTIQKLN